MCESLWAVRTMQLDNWDWRNAARSNRRLQTMCSAEMQKWVISDFISNAYTNNNTMKVHPLLCSWSYVVGSGGRKANTCFDKPLVALEHFLLDLPSAGKPYLSHWVVTQNNSCKSYRIVTTNCVSWILRWDNKWFGSRTDLTGSHI